MEMLEKLKARYDILIKENQKVITKIKTSFPYNQKIMLEDENLYRRKKDLLNEKIFSNCYKSAYKSLLYFISFQAGKNYG